MTINTGISSALLAPKTFHVITYQRANRSLVSLPNRLLLVGIIPASGGTAAANTIYQVDDPTQSATLFVQGSIMDLMVRKAFETAGQLNGGPQIFALGLAETTTKQVETLTFGGANSTVDGDIVARIAGRYIRAGIASGTTPTNAGVALDAAIKAQYPFLGYTSTNAAGVVTLTANVKGTLHNDTIFDVVSVPAGLTLTPAQSVAGAGAVDIQPALDAMAGVEFDGVALPTHIAGDITKVNASIALRWTASEKKPTWFFFGEPGTIATAAGLAANHEGIIVGSWEQSRSMPFEIATALAVGALSKSRPNANYDGMQLPLYPPPIAYDYTAAELETALGGGLTPLSVVSDPASRTVVEGQGRVVRLVTSRTTLGGQPYTLTRDFAVSRAAWFMARQYDIAYANKFGPGALNPDGVLLTADTYLQIRDMVININKAAEDAQILANVDADVAKLVVEADANSVGRVNIDNQITIINGLHQLAMVTRVQV